MLRLRGLQALPLGVAVPYAQGVAAALTLLDGERLAGRRQLEGATVPLEQARAALLVRSAYLQAARRIAAFSATPFTRPAQLVLLAALEGAANDYRLLAVAARTHDKAGYARAASAVDAAEGAVNTAVAQLNAT